MQVFITSKFSLSDHLLTKMLIKLSPLRLNIIIYFTETPLRYLKIGSSYTRTQPLEIAAIVCMIKTRFKIKITTIKDTFQ